MGAVPGGVDTDRQPPMAVPLRHFLIGLAFLLAGAVVGVGDAAGAVPVRARLVHVHLLLAGWVCLTIMGAMTQFVPVWSNATLHSRRLANVQLVLVTAGMLGFVVALVSLRTVWLIPFGSVMLAGFWTFVYNIARTLSTVDGLDVTERHFAVALGFFLVLTALGLLLAVGFSVPVSARLPLARSGLVGAHATVAVFGAVLTTVYGALYQLGTMFTQTELHGIDHRLKAIEEIGHPIGVVVLAAGRLVGSAVVASVGGLLVLLAALAFGSILARKLYEMRVEPTPMHTRYGVVAAALLLWALLSVPAWLSEPLAAAHRFGASGTVHLLALGVIGFVVFGTLYHIVPFVVWVHRYSDRLGFEEVPMIDDLYDDRLAAIDGTFLFSGTVLLVVSGRFGLGAAVAAVAGSLVILGILTFTGNMLLVLRRHSPHTLDRIVLGALSPRRSGGQSEGIDEDSGRDAEHSPEHVRQNG